MNARHRLNRAAKKFQSLELLARRFSNHWNLFPAFAGVHGEAFV